MAPLLPTPVQASSSKRLFPILTGRQTRPLRLLLLVLASISTLAWTWQSYHGHSVLGAYDELDMEPNLGLYEQTPPLVPDSMDLSPHGRDVRAMLNFVTQFPDRPLPEAVLDAEDVSAVLRDEARTGGVANWDEGQWEPPLVVFSKTYCPFSKRAKALLSEMHLDPAPLVVEADLRSDTNLVKSLLTKLTHHSTFPNVFIGGVSVGGSDDLHALHASGKLEELLRAAGIQSHVRHDMHDDDM